MAGKSGLTIIAEDIDRTGAERNDTLNVLLNTMDGILSKSSKIMVVMTTNHVDICRACL